MRDGLIHRKIFAEVPPRVEYSVTELGISLGEAIRILASWVSENQRQIVAHRATYDERVEAEVAAPMSDSPASPASPAPPAPPLSR